MPKRTAKAVKPEDIKSPRSKKVKGESVSPVKSPSKLDDGVMPRDAVPRVAVKNDGKYFKIISWNVAGLRGTLKNKPTVLDDLVRDHAPDVLCLQETKLQTQHVADFKSLLPGYSAYWSCSTTKNGYSGTVQFIKSCHVGAAVGSEVMAAPPKAQKSLADMWKPNDTKLEKDKSSTASASLPIADAASSSVQMVDVTYDMNNNPKHSGEGRTIVTQFNSFYLVSCYVPNAGQGLVRLSYRINEWDVDMRNYLKSLDKPVIYAGDLNVAHLDVDFYNPTAKHISKQAGLTPQERNSFTELLQGGFKDSLRHLYPDAVGQYTYWSQRTFARPVNKGLRLDYFICSDDMFSNSPSSDVVQVLDSYVLHEDTIGTSDHCPVALLLELPQ